MYFAARDDEHHLGSDGGLEVDLWHAHGVRNDLNIFVCSAEAFGFTHEASLEYYCFCTDEGVFPKLHEANEQLAFVLERLREHRQLMALLSSSLARATGAPSDSTVPDEIYTDLTTVLGQDCDRFQLARDPGVILVAWIRRSGLLQSLIL